MRAMHNGSRNSLVVALVGSLGLWAGCAGPSAAVAHVDASARVAVAEPTPIVEKAAPAAYVQLQTVADRSAPAVSKAQRRARVSSMRALMVADLQSSPTLTLATEQALALGIPRFTVDATIESMERRVRGGTVEIVCELRVAVTNQRGKMLFFLTNGAAVRVPLKGFRSEFEAPLQRDALEGAARGINEELIARIDAETREMARIELAGHLLAAE